MMSSPLRRLRAISVIALLAGLIAGTTVQYAAAAPAAQTPTTWTVLVGGEAEVTQQAMGPAGAWQFMRFYPDTITVNVGDTIVWKLKSAEPHTVTFPKAGDKAPDLTIPEGGDSQRILFNPLAALPQGGSTYDGTALTGSGQMDPGPQFPKEYKLTFTQPGTFQYVCTFHSMMKGTVAVQAAGTAYPKTQAQIDADAAAQLAADTQAATKAEAGLKQVSTRPGPNGTTIHEIKMGYGDGTMAWMRFSPMNLTINAGDTVEWTQGDVDTPHTVTLMSGAKEPELVLVEPQPAGPPKLVLNPVVLAPAGSTTYSGKDYFNSGFIWGTQVPIPGPRTYSLVFDTPGTYEYICVLHDQMGMYGQITVLAKGAPAVLPATGGSSTAGPGALGLVALGGLGLVAAGTLVLKRSRSRRTL